MSSRPGGKVLDREFMYSIGDAAQLLEIHPQTLRLYDKEGLLLPARQRQWRFYTPHDVARVNAMRHLIHEAGMSLKGLCRLLGLIPCWDIMGCSTRRKNSCPRAAVRSQPCWSVNGNERGKCRSCRVYWGLSSTFVIRMKLRLFSMATQTQRPYQQGNGGLAHAKQWCRSYSLDETNHPGCGDVHRRTETGMRLMFEFCHQRLSASGGVL